MGEKFWGVKIEKKLLKCGYVLICAQLEQVEQKLSTLTIYRL